MKSTIKSLLLAAYTLAAMSLTANAQMADAALQATSEQQGLELATTAGTGTAVALAAAAPAMDESAWSGNIGPYQITMYLYGDNWRKGEIIGYYYYNDRPKYMFKLKVATCETINAKGTMKLVLKEYTHDGKNTGTFNGTCDMFRGHYYGGTFTNSKGQKYKFELM